jgi:hypothetical protein
MQNNCVESQWSGTLVHEIGHFLNLLHTHEGTSDGNQSPSAENVPRFGPNANCSNSGDYICDTNADPFGNINSSCDYTDGFTDSLGNEYIPPVSNIMSYYPRTCGWDFTPQQYQRMDDAVNSRLNHTSYNLLGSQPTDILTPSDLVVSLNDLYQVELSWNTNTNQGKAYAIERSQNGIDFQPLFLGGTGPNTSTFIDASVQSYTEYHYRVKALNDIPTHYSNIASVATSGAYCIPSHQSDNCEVAGIGVGLQNVTMTSCGTTLLNNDSACDGPLSVFSNTIDVVKSKSYDVEFSMITNQNSYIEQNVSMWLDIDQDGIFNEVSELIYQSDFQTAAPSVFSDQFIIPSNTLEGITTLRIRTRYRPHGTVDSPCDYYSFSEAEDYLVNVMSPANADPQIAIMDEIGSPADEFLCLGEVLALQATGGMYYE